MMLSQARQTRLFPSTEHSPSLYMLAPQSALRQGRQLALLVATIRGWYVASGHCCGVEVPVGQKRPLGQSALPHVAS